MDVFALRHADLHGEEETTRQLVGKQFSGHTLELGVDAGQCVRITTGAPLPAGADTVVMKENTRLEGDRVVVQVAPKPGQHVRKAGEDTRAGERVLGAGGVLTPTRIALASSQGPAELEVARRSEEHTSELQSLM